MAKLHQVQLDLNGDKVINQISLPESPYVVPSDANPLAPGTASPGLSDDYSRGDHRHPMQVVSKGNITKGENGDITVTTVGLESKINVQFPEYTASDNAPLTVADAANAGSSKEYARADHQHPLAFAKGTVSNGTTADVSFERDGDNVKLNMVDPAYAGHTDSESASNTMAATMPDGGIIIERAPGEKPVLKQKIGSTLEATKLGGTQATYTADASETATILSDVEEGALIVEGTGPIIIDADVAVSAETGNTLERKSDGLFVPKSAVLTANAGETDSILPSLAEGSLIVEGQGEILVETAARVSKAPNNAIEEKEDGIFVEATKELTEEHKTGYTFNGKPVYEKMFIGTLSSSTMTTEVGDVSDLDIDSVIAVTGILRQAVGNDVPMPFYNTASDYVKLYRKSTSNKLCIDVPSVFYGRPVNVTIRYTKTTD